MAIFEKTLQTQTVLDDTEKLICVIENAQNINKHTEYILRVQRGPNKENKWNVSRRYRDFAALHTSLQSASIDLPLPPKKLIGNMQPSFIAERQLALQNYINELLKHQVLLLALQVRSFLDPNNYPLSIAEQALQTVSIALRGEGRFELKGPLPDIGWRIRKHYFLVTDSESKANCLLSWQNYGPDRHLCDKDLQTAFKCIQNITHPHVDDILAIHSLESGAYVVRRIHGNGSVRDMLYGTDYAKNHLAKYGNPKTRKPFTTGQIAHYGYQLLEALKFLHDKGMPHGHIHPGNIAIVNQRAQLMDIENFLMGVPSLYRPYLLELRKASSETLDVYCFGRTLYEMAFASTLEQTTCDSFPTSIPEDLELVLRACLSPTSCKRGHPTLDELLYDPFFTRGTLMVQMPRETLHLKFPLNLKEELRVTVKEYEARLTSQQKLVRSAKREVRIQAILSSEEELKKQKRRAKKHAWKSMSSLGDGAPSHSASTASSPTPPDTSAPVTNGTAKHTQPTASAPDARSALLGAICNFDKSRLTRINSR